MSRRTSRLSASALVCALVISISACGGGDETTFSTPDDSSPTTTATEEPTGDAADLEAQLRASAAFDDSDFTDLSTSQQDCIVSGVAAEPDLAASALADSEPSLDDALALTTIMLQCAPEMVRDLMSDGDETGDEIIAALSDDELTCIVDELVADPTVLSDAVEGADGTAMGLALIGCAPEAVADSMAEELGITSEQAACLLDEEGALMQLMLGADELEGDDAFAVMEDLLVAYEDCGIDVAGLMEEGDLDLDGDSFDFGVTDEDLAQFRSDCEAGDLESCDALFFQSEVGSDDEDFGATCGGTTDGSTAGACSYVPPTDEDLAQYRTDCAAGDMDACDDLYYNSDIGSDDEDFGATCGGTTDGTEPGTCWAQG